MYLTIFRLLWPRLEKFLADQISEFLKHRREQQKSTAMENRAEDCPPCPPCPTIETTHPEGNSEASDHNAIWFSLSGLLLGSVFGLIGYIFIRDTQRLS